MWKRRADCVPGDTRWIFHSDLWHQKMSVRLLSLFKRMMGLGHWPEPSSRLSNPFKKKDYWKDSIQIYTDFFCSLVTPESDTKKSIHMSLWNNCGQASSLHCRTSPPKSWSAPIFFLHTFMVNALMAQSEFVSINKGYEILMLPKCFILKGNYSCTKASILSLTTVLWNVNWAHVGYIMWYDIKDEHMAVCKWNKFKETHTKNTGAQRPLVCTHLI